MAMRVILVLLCWGLVPLAAQADVWSPSTWIPSTSSKSKNVSVAKSHKKSGSKTSTTGRKPGDNSLMGLTSTPHDFLQRSKSVISPTKSKKASNTRTVSRTTSTSKNSSNGKKPSLLHSMFAGPEPPPPPQTVKEWLSLKRP